MALKSSPFRTFLYWAVVVLSLGTFFLAAKILPYFQARVRFGRSTMDVADRILVQRMDEGTAVYEIIKIHTNGRIRWLEYMCYRYLWLPVNRGPHGHEWIKIKYSTHEKTFKEIYRDHWLGLDNQSAESRITQFGSNLLSVPVPSYFKLFYTEVIHPFYIFQVASILIWLWDDYWIYATCIFIMAVASAVIGVWQARRNRVMLAEMCHSESVVRILRRQPDGSRYWHTTSSKDIAPGDLVEIRGEAPLSADMLLIQGSCLVNEASLTGESVPVSKVAFPHNEAEIFHPDVHGAKFVLYNGTSVLQSRPGKPMGAPIGSAEDPVVDLTNLGPLPDSSNADDSEPADSSTSYHKCTIGLSISTGFSTAKGELIRSIMFPRPTKFKFYRDSMRFVAVLFGISLIGLVYTIVIFSKWGSPVTSMIKRALDLVTISVPPALPIAMTIATAFAIQRLSQISIYCTSPQRVNVAGRVDVMCFDKTGTLTEDHLDVFAFLQASRKHPGNFKSSLTEDLTTCNPTVIRALATCHSLNILHGEKVGDPLEVKMFEATGWTLEDTAFQTSDEENSEVLAYPQDRSLSLHNIKVFEFSSVLQRMSVISEEKSRILATNSNGSPTLCIYSKGAPEMIKTLCIPESLPGNFESSLSRFTQQGKRVLGMARKVLPKGMTKEEALAMNRASVESNLEFVGFLILQNQLKPDTTEHIHLIADGSVRNVMVTGDNEHTGINVSRQCGILPTAEHDGEDAVYLISLVYKDGIPVKTQCTFVPGITPDGRSTIHTKPSDTSDEARTKSQKNMIALEEAYYPDITDELTANTLPFEENRIFAVNGKAFEYIRTTDKVVFRHLLRFGRVFARMSPMSKAHLIEGLQSLGHTVGMCGDGSNDVGALRQADVGLSLSDAEASVAAPFTSKIPSISSAFTLLREGRGALASSIACYKYMAVYSMIQLISCVILYSIGYTSRLTDPQFLWIDIFLVFPLSFLMGKTQPRRELSSRKPPGALVSWTVVGSVVAQTLLHLIFQLGFYAFLTWYYVPTFHPTWTHEQSQFMRIGTIFLFANFEYVGSCLAFSIARPWRAPMYTNWLFSIATLALFLTNALFLFVPMKWVSNLLSLQPDMEMGLKLFTFGVAIFEMIIAYLIEKLLINSILQPWEENRHALEPNETWNDIEVKMPLTLTIND